MQQYYGALLEEAGLPDNRENYDQVEGAIKFVLEMEGIPDSEFTREVSRWIGDDTSAKRMMVIRRLKDMLGDVNAKQ